jgi:hypothetical protein
VEVVQHHGGVREVAGDSGEVAPERVDGDDVDADQPLGRAVVEPAVHCGAAAVLDRIGQTTAAKNSSATSCSNSRLRFLENVVASKTGWSMRMSRTT